MIGPEIPAHLLAPQQHKDFEEEDSHQTERNPTGPQIPSHTLQHRSTTPADEDHDDAPGPMPVTPSTKSVSRGPLGKVSAPGPSTGRRPIGPERPHQLSHSYTTYRDNNDDDDDDDEIGPRPPPSGARQEEEDAVKRFMEVEETRRKKVEVSVQTFSLSNKTRNG